VYGVYSTTPPAHLEPPDQAVVQAQLDVVPTPAIADEHDGEATVATYSVVHGRDGEPQWGVLVCDLGDGSRAYARADTPELLEVAERSELVGATVQLTPSTESTAMGEARVNRAALR
jgi:acetyl-CoA C-acetyltransferase